MGDISFDLAEHNWLLTIYLFVRNVLLEKFPMIISVFIDDNIAQFITSLSVESNECAQWFAST